MGDIPNWQLIVLSSLSTGLVTAMLNKVEIKFLWKAVEDHREVHRELWRKLESKADRRIN